ncbi:hypothetical protein ACJ41O_009404 [Fusarium nematophilum]
MFLRHRVPFAAQRLRVARPRSIVPLLRYSTEATAFKPADSPGATDKAGETQQKSDEDAFTLPNQEGDAAKPANAAVKKSAVWDSPHPVVKTGTFAASRVLKSRLAPAKPVRATPASETPAPAIPGLEIPAQETPAPAKPMPAKPLPAKPAPAWPAPSKPASEKLAPEKPTPKPTPAKPTPAKPATAKTSTKRATAPPAPPASSNPPTTKKDAYAKPAASGPENPYTPAPVAEQSLPPAPAESPKNVAWTFKPTDHGMDINWEKSWYGIGSRPVSTQQNKVLSRPISPVDVEVKPDGIVYLPEIKYRRRLNEAFGPMGWGMVHRGEAVVGTNIVTREYALIVGGRMVAQAQGVNNYFSNDGLPHAIEGCKSNALMRCCKDLGIASELWDPVFLRWFRKNYMEERWVENVSTKKKRTFWYKKGLAEATYPYKLV